MIRGLQEGEDGEGISSIPWREMGVCNRVGQGEVRSGPGHLNGTQDFAPEESHPNPRTRNTVLLDEDMLSKRDRK